MKKLFVLLITLGIVVSVVATPTYAGSVMIENFDSFANNDALRAAWKFEAGDPITLTIENTAVESGKAVKMHYPTQNLCFGNIRAKMEIEVPSNATGIELWVRNDGDPFVLTALFRGKTSRIDYYAFINVPQTTGAFCGFKFEDCYDGSTKQPTAMVDTAFEDFGFSVAMGHQPVFDNFTPKTFYVDSIRFVTEGGASSTAGSSKAGGNSKAAGTTSAEASSEPSTVSDEQDDSSAEDSSAPASDASPSEALQPSSDGEGGTSPLVFIIPGVVVLVVVVVIIVLAVRKRKAS